CPGAGRRLQVTLFKNTYAAIQESEEMAAWLSEFIEQPCKLVRMADDCQRLAAAPHDSSLSARVGFVDAYPILLISEESLADLNSRLEPPVEMNRFRPNITVRGAGAYGEDKWHKVRIGEVAFSSAETCARCTITTVNQANGERGKEPLNTLN